MRGCCIFYKFRGEYFCQKNKNPCFNRNFAHATCERNPSFLLLALFVFLSHFPLPQNPVSLASSSLSLKIEHIGGIQGDNTSTAADLGEPPNDRNVFNFKRCCVVIIIIKSLSYCFLKCVVGSFMQFLNI